MEHLQKFEEYDSDYDDLRKQIEDAIMVKDYDTVVSLKEELSRLEKEWENYLTKQRKPSVL